MNLPLEYRWLKANGFKGFIPWYLMDEPGEITIRSEYQKETEHDFFPFARRQDCDKVAGFKIINNQIDNKIISIHLTWSGHKESTKFPQYLEYEDLFEWIKLEVFPDTTEWMSEEELNGIQN